MDRRKMWQDYRAELLEMIKNERAFVDLVAEGKVHTGSREIDQPWVDTTADNVEQSKRSIAVLEGVVRKIEKDHLG